LRLRFSLPFQGLHNCLSSESCVCRVASSPAGAVPWILLQLLFFPRKIRTTIFPGPPPESPPSAPLMFPCWTALFLKRTEFESQDWFRTPLGLSRRPTRPLARFFFGPSRCWSFSFLIPTPPCLEVVVAFFPATDFFQTGCFCSRLPLTPPPSPA